MTSRGNVQGGVLVNVLKAKGDDVTWAMSKGGVWGACECLHPPFRKSCICTIGDNFKATKWFTYLFTFHRQCRELSMSVLLKTLLTVLPTWWS